MPGAILRSDSLPRWPEWSWPPIESASAKLRAAMERFPADRRLPQRLADKLAVWIARDIKPYPSDPKSAGEPQGRLDPDVHARAVIRALESRCEALGVYPALLPAAAVQVCGIAVGRGAEQRKAGRLDDARWTAASLSAFAKMLARRDPNEAAFHLVLSEAFEQEAKNAWKVKDFPTIEAATRNALGAACTALHLDPRNADARIKVAGLQDKLIGLPRSDRRRNELATSNDHWFPLVPGGEVHLTGMIVLSVDGEEEEPDSPRFPPGKSGSRLYPAGSIGHRHEQGPRPSMMGLRRGAGRPWASSAAKSSLLGQARRAASRSAPGQSRAVSGSAA